MFISNWILQSALPWLLIGIKLFVYQGILGAESQGLDPSELRDKKGKPNVCTCLKTLVPASSINWNHIIKELKNTFAFVQKLQNPISFLNLVLGHNTSQGLSNLLST